MVNSFRKWDVRLQWEVSYPSLSVSQNKFKIYGVDRDSEEIARNLFKISSLEEYGQGWGNGIPDMSITIFTKEQGPSFEAMRRLAATETEFDLELSLVPEENPDESGDYLDDEYNIEWMDGYEVWIRCRVNTERSNHNIAEFPLKEFGCVALRRKIRGPGGVITLEDGETKLDYTSLDDDEINEGDGSYSEMIDLTTT